MSTEANKRVIRGLVEEVWNGHDPDAVARFVGSEILEETRAHTDQFLAAISDARITIEDLIAEGDKVAARLTVSGTSRGPFAGHPPTGRRVTFTSMRMYRVADGKIVESWAMQDRLGLLQQLGVLPPTDEDVHWAGDVSRDG